MPVTLITTVGAVNANSYADMAFATTYFEGTLRMAEWIALESAHEDGGSILLLEAMTFIERLACLGLRVAEAQALNFPKYGGAITNFQQSALTAHLRDLRNRIWPVTAIPAPVKEAQCEQALAIGQNHRWLQHNKYTSEKLMTAGAELQLATTSELGSLCRAAMLKMQPFLLRGGQGGTVR
ncbi:MAG: hypothetical protein MOB07_23275 [Acidobacteria bacterium]|nr:hypothetical protein [Acidobacteriota bacterium]